MKKHTLFIALSLTSLNAWSQDGSLDTSFDPGTGVTGTALAISAAQLQPAGKILIGGEFSSFNGIARNNIARLNANGTLDTSFDLGSGVNDAIRNIHVLTDGKIVITGWFFYYNGVFRAYIARINADGSLDNSFDPGNGLDEWVFGSAVQADGKIIFEVSI